MAIPERDTVYTNDGTNRTTYTRESNSTGWFVGIIVALALLAIGYLVFSANSGPATTDVDVNSTPAVESPVTDPAATPAPMTEAPATETAPPADAPAVEAPAADAPAADAPAADAPAMEAAPADPAAEPAAPAAQ
jgi:type IV secretory pathway VirB10-like protein